MSTRPNTTPSDEIDLRELACTLWQRKGVIIAITAVCTALAAAYAYTATPVYQTSVSVLPPPASSLIEFNAQARQAAMASSTLSNASPSINGTLSAILTPAENANLLFNYLSSNAIKAQFSTEVMQAHYPGIPAPAISASKNASGGSTLTVTSSDPQSMQAWAESYLQLGRQATQAELNLRLDMVSKARQEQLRQDLAVARAVAEAGKGSDQAAQQQAEAVALQVRLTQLQGSAPAALSIPVYTVDTPAATPTAPIKPKKKLIIALGLVLGGMLGSFLVLLQHTFRRPGSHN